ncbi:class I SAM-dependent methyltransferase [Rhizobium sullae]|uniref:class I SAM-dependent methyltransferase n=1 Tax=Rhizobium sullae TaxID=50338 RepID=UPI000B34C53E|nr:class I SAM-dependent methyltransferase [Rhizobium sullae]
MLVPRADCIDLLLCPRTMSPLRLEGGKLVANDSGSERVFEYRMIDGAPILIDFEQSVFTESEITCRNAGSAIVRPEYTGLQRSLKRMVSPAKSGTRVNILNLVRHLEKNDGPSKVLIIGGGSVGNGLEPVYDHPRLEVYSFDVYVTPHVQFVADAHKIPLPAETFDCVIVQAVLEHVLQPSEVVAEIWRVLKPSGLVYAETPFMQQVHEGAFDFTRFTESGHRYLFRQFERLDSGANGGPGIQFMWAVDYLASGLFRSRKVGKMAKLACFWAQYLDHLIPAPYAEDGASGVFFYGRKTQRVFSPPEIIAHYRGAQATRR